MKRDFTVNPKTGPFPGILGKGPWLELGKKYAAFGVIWGIFLEVLTVKQYKNT